MKLVKISNEYYLLDGEINDGDKILHEGDILTVNKNKGAYLSTYQFPHIDIKADVCDKIIGSSNSFFGTEIPFLDRNKIEKLLNGDDDVEKLAMDTLKDKWSHLYQFGYPTKPFPTNYQNDLNCVMLGILQKQNSDKKFSLDEINEILLCEFNKTKHTGEKVYHFYTDLKEIFSKHKEKSEWSVEIEMDVVPDFESRSRDNDGQICNGIKKLIPSLNNGYITITKIKK